MIYQFLRFPLVTLYFFFYRRIYVTGRHNIPKDAPTLIASNHTTAFMEQILVAGLQLRSVYFWASGAVLETQPKLTPIFKGSHVIPIWKRDESIKKMYKNKQTFESSKDIILEGKMLFIAPEGNSVSEKRLREFKTGTARLALLTAAANNFEKDIFIVPTGVNYTYHIEFRSEAIVSFGEPINIKEYKALYEANPKNAARELTEDLKDAISRETVVINSVEDEELVEQLHIVLRNQHQHYNDATYSNNSNRLKLEQDVANVCNKLPATKKQYLKQQAKFYFDNLNSHPFDDKAVQQKGAFHFGQFTKASLLSPLALLGWIGGLIPVQSARYLRNKTIKNKQFLAPMALVFSFITWSVYSLLISFVGAFFLGWATLALPPALVALQYIAFKNKEDWKDLNNNKQYRAWKRMYESNAQIIENERRILIKTFEEAKMKKSRKAALELSK